NGPSSRLVPPFSGGGGGGRDGPAPRGPRPVGDAEMRGPPAILGRGRAARQQKEQTNGGAPPPGHTPTIPRWLTPHSRCSAQRLAPQDSDRAERAPELPALQCGQRLPTPGSDQEVRQAERGSARWCRGAARREPEIRRVARVVHRRDVVPGPVDLRFPA